MLNRICLSGVLVASFCSFVWGQDFRATITGQVTDSSKSAVPNADVKATNLANNELKETKANSSGYYSLPYLNPGTYKVDVSAPGFQTLIREGIILQVADKLNLPLVLQVGQMTQEVTVVGEQAVIQTCSNLIFR